MIGKPLLMVGALVASGAAMPPQQVEAAAQERLIGFSQPASVEQLRIEEIFAQGPSPASARRHHQIVTEEPHVEGTPAQRRVAGYIRDHFEKSGIPAQIVEYQVYLPYPRSVSLWMVEPEEKEFLLKEEPYGEDKDSYSKEIILPFHAYSPSGEVDGQVVYANYGLPDDYAYLKEQGIDPKGRIVLVRYGRSFRGVKVKVAEENGALGVLIYSDPFDDGYFQGDIYPRGPMRPPTAIQRGSVEYIFVYPGDPLTPGRPSLPNVQRLAPQDAANLPRIPSLPLSYGDASDILRSLAGANVPSGWQGALAFAYHLGPGPSKVRMKIEIDYDQRPVWNVVGRIEGAQRPNEWVLLGNHIDAWTYGGVDPNSGTTAMLEMATGLGKLLEAGLRPQRTLIIAGWGGEEYGLIGSTEWGEEHADELIRKSVAYLNVDAGVSGNRFNASAVPILSDFLRQVTRSVRDPWRRDTVYDNWRRAQANEGEPPPAVPTPGALGSGSDYTVFLDHLGIPAADMGFGGPYGVYHSLYDSHHWMDRFGDPGWQYHPAMAEVWGRAALRLANSEILPFNYAEYGKAISGYLGELEKRAAAIQQPDLFTRLREAAADMERIGGEIQSGRERLLSQPLDSSKRDRINELFRQAERGFVLEDGLPRRPWFRHAIYAPGYYTGYASQPLPGLSESIDNASVQQFQDQVERLLRKLEKVNRTLDQIRRLTQ